MRATLSIGSNLSDSRSLLRGVYDYFSEELVAASPIYRTPAWGVTDQPHFLNAVLIVDVDCSPHQLLRIAHDLEADAGRVRQQRWGPRTLDVDIVVLDDERGPVTSSDADLTVPHVHAHERAFVLVPWHAANSDAHLHGKPLQHWIDRLDPSEVAGIVEDGEFGQ